jgi:hypothetical protein
MLIDNMLSPVTIQQHPFCFVIGLLMYEPVHFADFQG